MNQYATTINSLRPTIVIFSLTLCVFIDGQTPTDQDCLGAIPICENIYVQENAYSGEGNFTSELGLGLGCNFAETNSVWYTFTIQESGLFSFILTPVNSNDDYDWALFNLTDATCADIATDVSLEVSCNSYGEFGNNGPTGISSANGGTGNSNGPGNLNGPPFNADLPVVQGEIYALVVMDWSGTPTGYTLDLSNTTASIFDDEGPQVAEADLHCDNTIDLVFDEQVVCGSLDEVVWQLEFEDGSTLDASAIVGDCAGPAGLTMTATLTFDEDIFPMGTGVSNFTLHIIDEPGNVVDFCGNEVAFDDLSFDFESSPIEVLPQVIDSDCDADNGQVDASAVFHATAPITYDLSGVSQATPVFNGLAPGEYTLTITDADFCTDVEVVTIGQPEPPVIQSVTTTPVVCGQHCSGSVVIESEGALSFSIDGGLSTSPSGEFQNVCEGLYDIVVSTGNNCESFSSTSVGLTSPIEAVIGVEPFEASIFAPFFTFFDLSEGSVESVWTVTRAGESDQVYGDTVDYTVPHPLPGLYDLTLEITDTAGCVSHAIAQFSIFEEFTAFIPSAFTPNGDGLNDTFQPVLNGHISERYSLKIFDQWGTVVFESEDPEEPWVGQIADGDHYPQSEVFHYVLRVQPVSTAGHEVRKGSVTLVR